MKLDRPISNFLSKGKENAIQGRVLANMLGLDLRQVTKMIEAERREGSPICANCNTEQDKQGYFLAETKEELEDYLKSLKNRAIEMLKTRQAIIRRARENE